MNLFGLKQSLMERQGYGLMEFLVAGLIFLVISSGLFEFIAHVQREAARQEEIEAVLESARFALATVERILLQAGNDPKGIGFTGITISSPTQVRILADLTGSAKPASPDKGDPDGDLDDSGEDVIIRYNPISRSLELISGDSGTQPVSSLISEFSMQYLDRNGVATGDGAEVYKIQVTLSATSALAESYSLKPFSIRLTTEVCIASRF